MSRRATRREPNNGAWGTPVAGRFTLVDRIAEGTQSTIFEAHDQRHNDRRVAVKLFDTNHPSGIKESFFKREIGSLDTLTHPHIIGVQDHGWDDLHESYYVALDYVPRTLLNYIERHRNDESDERKTQRLSIMRSLCDALAYAHSTGVIHRDIKPTNVLLKEDDSPVLTDFSSSWIKDRLSVGETVSGFYSRGYAAPEQLRGDRGTIASDLYSLGVTCFHLVTGQEPPPEGISPDDVDAAIIPASLKAVIRTLLASEPSDRYPTAVELSRALASITDYGGLPTILVHVTDRAMQDLYDRDDRGDIAAATFRGVEGWLISRLDGRANAAVAATSTSAGDIHLLIDDWRLICRPETDGPAIIITAVDCRSPYSQEKQRRAAIPVHAVWDVRASAGAYGAEDRRVYRSGQVALLDQLADHEKRERGEARRRDRRHEHLADWTAALDLQQRLIDTAPSLRYVEVRETDDRLTFVLKDVRPDDLTWQEGDALAVTEFGSEREEVVGTLASMTDRTIVVRIGAIELRDGGRKRTRAFRAGQLRLSQRQQEEALRRQKRALVRLQTGLADNRHLLDMLMDIRQVEFDEGSIEVDLVQPSLADDQKKAVQRALAAEHLFLLQGPPGTGKTTVIVEIILQELRRNQDARILVSSQSNTAVDNVLEGLETHRPGLNTVRLGRQDKIGKAGEAHSVAQALDRWRADVLTKTDATLATLAEQERLIRHRRDAALPAATPETFDTLIGSIAQAGARATILRALERGAADQSDDEAEEDIGATVLDDSAHDAGDQADQQSIDEHRQALANALAGIRDLLPDEERGMSCDDPLAEYDRLVALVRGLSDRYAPDKRLSETRALILEWRDLFGRTEDPADFEAPLVKRANVVAATCLFVGGRDLKDQHFDLLIVDEAGRATPPEISVPMVRARRSILVGDERQLPPYVDDELVERLVRDRNIDPDLIRKSQFE